MTIELYSLRDILARIAGFLRVDAEQLTRGLLQVLVIWIVVWMGVWMLRVVSRRIIAAVDDGDDFSMSAAEKRGHTIAQLLRSVGGVVLLSIGCLLTLNVFIPIGALLAGAGILGLALSFGSQSLVKDLIAGFFVLVENQFGVGDTVEAVGKSGVVERMTLRVVMLRDVHGVLHIIPNGQITTVSNMTRGWSRAVVEVGVAYGTDVDRALAVFGDEARRFADDREWGPRLDGAPEVPGVESLGDNAMVIRTLLRTAPGAQWEVAREYRRLLKIRLDLEGIEIPFPHRTLHVRFQDQELARTVGVGAGLAPGR